MNTGLKSGQPKIKPLITSGETLRSGSLLRFERSRAEGRGTPVWSVVWDARVSEALLSDKIQVHRCNVWCNPQERRNHWFFFKYRSCGLLFQTLLLKLWCLDNICSFPSALSSYMHVSGPCGDWDFPSVFLKYSQPRGGASVPSSHSINNYQASQQGFNWASQLF